MDKKNKQDATLINISALKTKVKQLEQKLKDQNARIKHIEKFLMRVTK